MTRTASLLATNGTSAQFRAWINEIHSALLAFGWTQASSAGTQIDFATVTRPTAINTYQGYAVYFATDTIASTTPLYLRLDFGTGATLDAVSVKVQVGLQGVDTSGNLTGITTTTQVVAPGITVQTVNSDLRTAGNAGSFRLLWRVGTAAQNPMFFAIERDQSTSGADTSSGVNLVSAWHAGFASQFIEKAGGIGTPETKLYAMVSAQPSQAANGIVGVGPIRCTCGVFRNPMKTALIVAKGDFPPVVTYPGTIYGVSRNYLINTEATGFNPNGWNTVCGIAILWE